MNKRIILLSTLLLVSLATVTGGLSIEEQAQAKSIIGNTADGYESGKEAGEYHSENGYSYDSECPENDSLAWCAGYKSGYFVGYEATEATD
jgi:hypothetical protein